MTVVRLPTAAKRKVRVPHLTGDQLAERGIRRILPACDPAPVLTMALPFDPTNPAHVHAWNNLVAIGRSEVEREDRS